MAQPFDGNRCFVLRIVEPREKQRYKIRFTLARLYPPIVKLAAHTVCRRFQRHHRSGPIGNRVQHRGQRLFGVFPKRDLTQMGVRRSRSPCQSLSSRRLNRQTRTVRRGINHLFSGCVIGWGRFGVLVIHHFDNRKDHGAGLIVVGRN